MGYTWEVDAHLYFKRAYALEPAFGSREDCADTWPTSSTPCSPEPPC